MVQLIATTVRRAGGERGRVAGGEMAAAGVRDQPAGFVRVVAIFTLVRFILAPLIFRLFQAFAGDHRGDRLFTTFSGCSSPPG